MKEFYKTLIEEYERIHKRRPKLGEKNYYREVFKSSTYLYFFPLIHLYRILKIKYFS